MSTGAAYFDETLLLKRFERTKNLGADSRLKADHEANFDVVKALMENNVWTFGELKRSDKIIKISAMHPHACGITAKDYTEEEYCEFDCNEGSGNEKEYEMPTPIYTDFCINEMVGLTNELNDAEFFAEDAITAEVKLLENLAQKAAAFIEANLGVNVYSGKGVVSGTDTIFAPAFWTSNMVADLVRIAKMNKFSQSYILDSGVLWNQKFNAKDFDKTQFDKLKYYSDLVNIDLINDPDHVAYMIDKGAIGITSKTFLPDFSKAGPKQITGDTWRWSQPMALDPRFVMDVHMKIACVKDQKVWMYKYILNYFLGAAPTGCDGTNTGILRLLCGNV